jgi:hypothetical protein
MPASPILKKRWLPLRATTLTTERKNKHSTKP